MAYSEGRGHIRAAGGGADTEGKRASTEKTCRLWLEEGEEERSVSPHPYPPNHFHFLWKIKTNEGFLF